MILRWSSKRTVLRHAVVARAFRPTRRAPLSGYNIRLLTCSAVYQQENATRHGNNGQSPSAVQATERIKLESMQKNQPATINHAPKTDTLLTEQTVSNKEQREADWAILKEMSRYLWPKVRLLSVWMSIILIVTKDDLGTKVRVSTALALLVGSKVISACFNSCLSSLKNDTDPQRPGSFLFQKHC